MAATSVAAPPPPLHDGGRGLLAGFRRSDMRRRSRGDAEGAREQHDHGGLAQGASFVRSSAQTSRLGAARGSRMLIVPVADWPHR
jgi:hypothetical protein